MSKVYVIEAKRSPLGKFLGSISTLPPQEIASQVIQGLLHSTGIDPDIVDEVIIGNILSAGHGQNVGRQAAMKAGLSSKVPAYTINILCGSGMKSVMTAYSQIKAKMADVVIAGGVENMSQAAFVVDSKIRQGNKMGELKMQDTLLLDGLTDAFHQYHMGVTAENIVEKYGLTREQQDQYAISSQEKAIKAIDMGKFADEIVPIEIQSKKGTTIFDTDEYPNRTTSYEKLQSLRPAFKKDGTVTAGNSSGINDGASMLLIASEEAVEKYQLKPIAEIVAVGQGGVEPEVMGLGPVPAIRQALKFANLQLKDMELVELNEAFAAQALGVLEELKQEHRITDEWIEERVNVNGGAIALGHPLGASGARILTTLIYEMRKRKVTYGLASLCIGGGMGTGVIVKSV